MAAIDHALDRVIFFDKEDWFGFRDAFVLEYIDQDLSSAKHVASRCLVR